jgi:beta-glucosidase
MNAAEREQARQDAVDAALARLDLDGKVALLSGADMWSVPANPGIGLGRLLTSDGPVGVRGESWTAEDPSLALPSPTGLAASWDPETAKLAGRVLAQEARRKGVHVVLTPTINLHRAPYGGRHFEAYSEDPLLTGAIGAAVVEGVQSGGVGTTPKHYVANDSETDRMTVDARVEEAALRELYLAPFEYLVRTAGPWGLMAAYNQVNGTTMSEHDRLNNGVLRGEWGFDGVLVSDWTGARDTVGCALGGLDLVMPGPVTVYGENLIAAVRAGTVPEQMVDTAARRMLLLAARVGILEGAPAAVEESELPAPLDGEATARQLAVRSFVLLRNQRQVLPLAAGTEVRRIAVSGRAAQRIRPGGGGSAQVFPTHVISPLDGLRAALPADVELSYAPGPDPSVRYAPAEQGFTLRAALLAPDDTELGSTAQTNGQVLWLGALPGGVSMTEVGSVELLGEFTPEVDGAHRFSVAGVGQFRLQVGEQVLFDGDIEQPSADPASGFLNPPRQTVEVELKAGQALPVRLRNTLAERDPRRAFGLVAFELGHAEPLIPEDELIAQAVREAEDADVAVVFVGSTSESESEGIDRETLALSGRQDELVSRVAAANPNTVVVVNSGAPVLMPWRDEAAAVLLAWFPGQEGGHAIADVLLGAAEPGGRLPTTWPAEEKDLPVSQVTPDADGRLPYTEGRYIGHRAWRRTGAEPAYWFGHGLGYTDWEYEGITVRSTGAAADADAPYAAVAEVEVRVRNTGQRPGRETVQLYLGPEGPEQTLAAFAVVEAEPGATAVAHLRVPLRSVQRWDETAAGWRTVTGPHPLAAGRSAADLRLGAELSAGS